MSIKKETRGRWVDILTSLGIDAEVLVNKHHDCPLCGKRKSFRFDDKEGNGTYVCTCGAGDGSKLAMTFLGRGFKETAAEIRSVIGECRVVNKKPVNDLVEKRNNKARLKRIQVGLKPIKRGTAAYKYLKKRGIDVVPAKNCKAHDGIPYYDDSKKVGVFPAIVSTVMNYEGKPASFHIIYLDNEGNKLDCEAPKKVMPVAMDWKGGGIRLFEPTEILGIAEGIETCLAAYQDDGYPMWASVNYMAMQNIIIPRTVKTVVIYVDEDKSFSGQQGAYILARRLKVVEGRDVKVVRLIGEALDPYIDTGLGCDYLDYVNRHTVKSRTQARKDLIEYDNEAADDIAVLNKEMGGRVIDLEMDNGKKYQI